MPVIGLTVSGGRLQLNGQRFRNIGLNWGGAITRIFGQVSPTACAYTPGAEQDAFIAYAQSVGARVVRIKATPFYPAQWTVGIQNNKAWNVANATDRALHYAQIDSFLAKLKAANMGAIVCMFFRWPTIPDLVGENCRQWLAPASNTRTYATTITQELVNRYTGGARADLAEAVWGWEFGNETNHVNDYNATPSDNGMWGVNTAYGTQTAAAYNVGGASVLTTGGTYDLSELRTILAWWDGVVSAIDPTRLRMSGNGPNSYWQPAVGGSIIQPLDRWVAQQLRDNPHNSVCIHWYGGLGYSSFNSRGLSACLAASRSAAQSRGQAFVVGEYGNQPRTITSIVVFAGTATVSVSTNWASEVGDVVRVVGAGGLDGDYTITALPGGQNSPATLRAPTGTPNGSAGVGVVQHLASQFQRMTADMAGAQVDLALVWCYESDPFHPPGESLTQACNVFQGPVIRDANQELLRASW